jgi:translation elongation factor P/translation initiation factor 5A
MIVWFDNRLANAKSQMGLTSSNEFFGMALILAAVIMLLCLMSGCSVIGLAIGADVDREKSDKKGYAISEIERFKPGKEVTVVLNTKDMISGKYLRTTQISDHEYALILSEFREESPNLSGIPAPGDTITIFDLAGRQWTFELIGYNYDYLRVKPAGKTEPIVFLIRNIAEIVDRDKQVTSGEELEVMIAEKKIPVIQAMVLDVDGDTVVLATSKVDRVFSIDKKNRIWKGLAIGLAIDLALVIWFITQLPLDFGLR